MGNPNHGADGRFTDGASIVPEAAFSGKGLTHTYLHGTTMGRLESIKKQGLIPTGHGLSIYTKPGGYMATPDRQQGVYITKSYTQARQAAVNAVFGNSDSRYHRNEAPDDLAILHIEVPKGAALGVDSSKPKSDRSFMTSGHVPPEWIKGFVRIPKHKVGNPDVDPTLYGMERATYHRLRD